MRTRLQIKRRDLLLTLTLLAALGVTTALIKWQADASRQQDALQAQRAALQERIKNGLYVAEPGQRADDEAKNLLKMEEYWSTRIGYPTGKFDFKWVQTAAAQDKGLPAAVPAGRVTYNRANNQSPLALNPSAWTNIGPQPQNSNTCSPPCFIFNTVAGRVNDVVVDPMTPTIAYLAPDGGGVWRTTNCCSPATLWVSATTDSPLINTTVIGDISADRNNGNIYAGTGDLSFGSFSFGSAGVLKSTDHGVSWQLKGTDVFGPYYPQGQNQFPQYNSISKVEPDPSNSNTLIVGAKPGVYFSYNAGDTWTGPCLPDPFADQRQDITAVQVHTTTTGLSDLFVAVGSRGYSTTVQYNLANNGANGIYKASVPSPATGGCPANWNLISRPDNGWPAGTGSGVPRFQGGNPVGRIDLAMAPSNPNYIYAQVQAIDPQASCGGARGCQLGIWRTTNGGTTWQQMSDGETLNRDGDTCGPLCAALPELCGDYAQNWYDQNIIVHPTNPNTIFFQNHNLWRSTDGGSTLQDLTCGYGYIDVPPPSGVHVDNHAMYFVPGNPNILMVGSDGGSYITMNANDPQPAFSNLNTTLNTIEFYSGDVTQNFATNPAPAAAAGAQDNGSSVWTGNPNNGPFLWNQRLGGDGFFARFDPITEKTYLESQNGNLNLLGPRGSGQAVAIKGSWSGDRLSFIFPYEIYKGVPTGTPGGGEDDCVPQGCQHMIAGTYRVWETVAGGLPDGSSWYINSPDLTKGTLADRSFINQLAYAPRTDDLAIVGTNDGNVQIGFNLGGGGVISATWANVTGNNAVLPNRPVLDVAFDPNVLQTTVLPVGYAAVGGFNQNTPSTPGHVFRVACTTPLCATFTWQNKTGNLPNIPAEAIIANPNFPQQVFVGTDWGVYYTNDINAATPSWIHFNAGMPNVMVWDFAIDRGFTTLAAFTRSRGAYVWPLTSAAVPGTPEPTATGTQVLNTPVVPATYTPAPPGPTNTATPSFTPGPTNTAIACGGTTLFNETFESGTLGQFVSVTITGTMPWIADNSARHSGIWSAHVPNGDTVSDQRLEMQSPVAVPTTAAQAYMQFWHRYSFENDQVPYDGGVMEYSTDNGATWLDAGPLMIEGQYNGVILLGANNPLGGRQGWTNQSAAYPNFNRVTLDLNTLRGMSVKFRFREGSDDNTGAPGWWVDDVVINSQPVCGSATTGVSTATATRVASVTSTATAIASATPGCVTNSDYTYTASTGATMVPATSYVLGSTCNSCTVGITLPFPYTFYGTTYTSVHAANKGNLQFISNSANGTDVCFPAPQLNDAILPYWDELNTNINDTMGVFTSTQGTAPNRIFTIRWYAGYEANDATANFEVRLYEGQPKFEFIYGNVTRQGFSATIGVQKGTGERFTPYSCNTPPGGVTGLRLVFDQRVCTPAGASSGSPQTQPIAGRANGDSAEFSQEKPQSHCDTSPVSFKDMSQEAAFTANAVCLACRGVVSGYSDGTFKPSNTVTRGQLAKMVSNAAGFSENVTIQLYADVTPTDPFYPYITRLTMRGYMSGYPCGGTGEPCNASNAPYFRPADPATRGQLARIAANSARYKEKVDTQPQIFEDVPPTHPMYAEIERLAARGIVTGYKCGGIGEACSPANRAYFRPQQSVSRGQAARVIASTFFPDCADTIEK